MDADDPARTPDASTPEPVTPAADADHVRLELHVSRSRAFDAYVRDFGQWWQLGRTPRTVLHVEQHAGGAIVEHAVGGEETQWGEVLDVEVGSRIRHSYRHAGEHPAVVTAEFSDGEHGGAIVEIRHEPWEGSDDERDALRQAWTQALRRLTDDASAV